MVLRKLNKAGRRNAGLIAILGLLLTAGFFTIPRGEQTATAQTEQAGPLDGILSMFRNEQVNLTGHEALTLYIKYEAASIEEISRSPGASGAEGAHMDVTGTATTGDQAKFQLKAGSKVLEEETDKYAEPASFWVVTVPLGSGATHLIIAAGSAVLEVDLQ